MKVRALLLDTRSIQKYIFSGNKLRTNIGASYMVEHLFEKDLVHKVVAPKVKDLGWTLDSQSWKEQAGTISDLAADCYVAYIGGGNALLLFKADKEDIRASLVTEFTKQLLVTYPGLRVGAALGDIDLDSFAEDLRSLYVDLKASQNRYNPCVTVPDLGLSHICDVNGQVANAMDPSLGNRLVSQEVMAKNVAAQEAIDALEAEFKDVIGHYKFPVELERLGQIEGHNDIAIVHIDGNNMGKKFQACQSLGERSQLSRRVAQKTKEAFRSLLQTIVDEYDAYTVAQPNGLSLSHQGVDYLPIRPLILGGDDITFVCNGQLALTYTKRFMEFLNKETEVNGGRIAIDSCAGIAILNTSYPFFRGYQLAEQLCDRAKEEARKEPGSSYLDFAILHGEQAPTLEQIREDEYQGIIGDLHFGPYQVDQGSDKMHQLHNLLACVDIFADKEAWPQSKLKGLRSALAKGHFERNQFMEQLRYQGKSLPAIESWEAFAENGWSSVTNDHMVTPYIDAIELVDFILEV